MPHAIRFLIVAALLVRAAVPTGWMPVAAQDGLRLMLCNGDGPVEIAMDTGADEHAHHGHHGSGPDEKQGGDHTGKEACPFGLALGKSADIAPPLVTGLPLDSTAPSIGPMPAAARLTAWRSLRPPARGPPHFA